MANRTGNRNTAVTVVALCALTGAAHGCSAPTAPPSVPGGGHSLALDFTAFADSVEPILMRHGCDAGGDCHGGGIRGTLELSPASAKDMAFDFDQVVLQTSSSPRDSSAILRKPLALAAGGTPHALKPFATTDDPEYRTILRWILRGVLR